MAGCTVRPGPPPAHGFVGLEVTIEWIGEVVRAVQKQDWTVLPVPQGVSQADAKLAGDLARSTRFAIIFNVQISRAHGSGFALLAVANMQSWLSVAEGSRA